MTDIVKIKKEVDKIKDRNKRVERDKAWETSNFRRIAIAIITYILITLFLIVEGVEDPFIVSIVPAIAFVLSTLTLGVLKDWWLKHQK